MYENHPCSWRARHSHGSFDNRFSRADCLQRPFHGEYCDPGGGTPQWTSGVLDLSSYNVSIGPSSSVSLQLNLNGNVTTAVGINNNYGAGIVVNPLVASGAEIFGFTYQLYEAGSSVGSPFGFDLLNPFAFPVDNVGTGLGGGPAGVTFDRVDVTIYNTTLTESVSSFQVFLGVPSVSSVPDTSSTAALLFVGIVSIAVFGSRKMTAAWRN